MRDKVPEEDLELALEGVWNDHKVAAICESSQPEYFRLIPAYILSDAVERLKRYQVMVENLTRIGEFLWEENLRKYGGRKIHKGETPLGSVKDPTFQRMSCMVNPVPEQLTLDDAYVELTLSHCRLMTEDPTGLNEYLDREEDLFDQLEHEE